MTPKSGISEGFIVNLLNHRRLSCDILPRFQEDFVGSKLDFLLNHNYISREDYDEIDSEFDYDPELQKTKVAELLIKNRDKSDVISGLQWGFGASIDLIKEYIRQKYPEHFREIFNSNPDESDLTVRDLKSLHKYLNKHYNANIEIKKEK